MGKIAVFTNKEGKICDFFDSCKFIIYEKKSDKWEVTGETEFEKIIPSAPMQTRKKTGELLPLIDGCDIIAGGLLVGIPYSVFDMAKKHIFQIDEINGETFEEIIKEIQSADDQNNLKERIIKEARPVETSTPGVYSLDLIALQNECPEVSSKKAMADFLENTPFLELHLVCKHIPPWIENSGKYEIKAQDKRRGGKRGNHAEVLGRKF
ncbi:Fe-only nitrogenase accessory AnfO family protein [Treponema sp. R6D11]